MASVAPIPVVIDLSDATIDKLASRLAEQMFPKPLSPLMSVAEIADLFRCRSESATYRVIKRHGLKAATPGRYLRSAVMKAVQREGSSSYTRAQIAKRKAGA